MLSIWDQAEQEYSSTTTPSVSSSVWDQAESEFKGVDIQTATKTTVPSSVSESETTPTQPDESLQIKPVAKAIWDAWTERGKNITDIVSKKTSDLIKNPGLKTYILGGLGGAFDVAGEVAGGTADIFTKGLPASISGQTKKEISANTQPLPEPLKKAAIVALQKGGEIWDNFQKKYPEAAQHVKAAGNIASLMPLGKLDVVGGALGKSAGFVAEKIAPAIGETVGKVATIAEKNLVRQQLEDAWKVVSPKINKKNIQTGRVEEPGVLKGSIVKPTDQELKMVDAVKDIVNPNAHPIQNINNIRAKIVNLAKQAYKMTVDYPSIFNNSQIRKVLSQSKNNSRVLLLGNSDLEKAYDSITVDFMNILSKHSNNLNGLLDARKEFDFAMKSQKNTVFDRVGTVMDQARKDIRMSVNDFIASRLPEGNTFKDLLEKQSNMYRAIRNISDKYNPALDRSQFQRLTSIIRRHPWLSIEAAGAVGGGIGAFGAGGVLAHIVTNPLALGALATYGAYRLGKTVVTSRWVKGQLVNFLRKSESVLKPEEGQGIKKIIDWLSGSEIKTKSTGGVTRETAPQSAAMGMYNKWNSEYEKIAPFMKGSETAIEYGKNAVPEQYAQLTKIYNDSMIIGENFRKEGNPQFSLEHGVQRAKIREALDSYDSEQIRIGLQQYENASGSGKSLKNTERELQEAGKKEAAGDLAREGYMATDQIESALKDDNITDAHQFLRSNILQELNNPSITEQQKDYYINIMYNINEAIKRVNLRRKPFEFD